MTVPAKIKLLVKSESKMKTKLQRLEDELQREDDAIMKWLQALPTNERPILRVDECTFRADSRLLIVGVRIRHPTRGVGVIKAFVKHDPRGKPVSVLFDDAQQHSYSWESTLRKLSVVVKADNAITLAIPPSEPSSCQLQPAVDDLSKSWRAWFESLYHDSDGIELEFGDGHIGVDLDQIAFPVDTLGADLQPQDRDAGQSEGFDCFRNYVDSEPLSKRVSAQTNGRAEANKRLAKLLLRHHALGSTRLRSQELDALESGCSDSDLIASKR